MRRPAPNLQPRLLPPEAVLAIVLAGTLALVFVAAKIKNDSAIARDTRRAADALERAFPSAPAK